MRFEALSAVRPSPAARLNVSTQIPLPDVPGVAIRGVLGLEVNNPIGRRGHIRAEEERQCR